MSRHLIILLSLLLVTSISFAKQKRKIAQSVPLFKKIMIIVFENEDFKNVLVQPAFKELADKGALLTNYRGVAHPSQPNYIAMTAGSMHDIKDYGQYTLDVKHIGDLLEGAGKTWKVYAESFPGNCALDERVGPYVRKHTPFMSFANVTGNLKRCNEHVVEASQLFTDIKNNKVPDYSLYVPNMNNDGHDTSIEWADTWIRNIFLGRQRKLLTGEVSTDSKALLKLKNFTDDTLLVFTFDESGASDEEARKTDKNTVYTVFLGPMVKPGKYDEEYNHYSLVRLVEDNFALENLGQLDVDAKPITSIWK
jgi:hypothetical protein